MKHWIIIGLFFLALVVMRLSEQHRVYSIIFFLGLAFWTIFFIIWEKRK